MTEIERIAPMIVCPMCDEERCVGREKCRELQAWIEKRKCEQEKENDRPLTRGRFRRKSRKK